MISAKLKFNDSEIAAATHIRLANVALWYFEVELSVVFNRQSKYKYLSYNSSLNALNVFGFNRLLNSENISELVPELLVDNLERFVTNSTDEADSLRSKLLQLEAELNAAKQVRKRTISRFLKEKTLYIF